MLFIYHMIHNFNQNLEMSFKFYMNSSKGFFTNFVYSSILPELLVLLFVCVLITIAVTRRESTLLSYRLTLPEFLKYTAYFFFIIALYWLVVGIFFKYHAPYENFFIFYKTVRINLFILRIKTVIALLVGATLVTARRYLLLNKLVNYEYPLLISLATVGMFISVMANNWIILFLSLELQALCLLVLFAWNRKDYEGISAALKFSIVNFVASILILLAIVLLVLYTQTLTVYFSNPYFFIKQVANAAANGGFSELQLLDEYYGNWLLTQSEHIIDLFYNKTEFLAFIHEHQKAMFFLWTLFNSVTKTVTVLDVFGAVPSSVFYGFSEKLFLYYPLMLLQSYDSIKVVLLFDFVSFLLIIGFAIKLGLAPFGMWLQDLYRGVSLPVLNFFSTAPKFVYLTILVSLYLNLFSYVNGQHFLNMVLLLSIVCIIVANIAMFSVNNQLLHLLAWSSVANMGLLFLLLSRFPYKSYNIVFMIYYTVATLLFFLALQYIVVKDNKKNEWRNVLYFTDLVFLRHSTEDRRLFVIALFSLLSFFGIPPFIGFWMKFTVFAGIVKAMFIPYELFQLSIDLLRTGHSINFLSWVLFIMILFVTLVGSYNYLRIFYVLTAGEHKDLNDAYMVYCTNTKSDTNVVFYAFIFIQILFTLNYVNLTDMFDMQSLSLATVKYPR